jgi:hypothetical protein
VQGGRGSVFWLCWAKTAAEIPQVDFKRDFAARIAGHFERWRGFADLITPVF